MVSNQLKNSLILLLMSIIWGFAFAAQRLGADVLGPFTFFAFRNYFAVVTMLIFFLFIKRDTHGTDTLFSIKLGIVGGLMELVACVSQQYGIAFTTAANSSFITATYVIIVPILYLLLGRKVDKKLWFCVALELVGLYLLCIKGDFVINKGDMLTMVCAFVFAVHIVLIARGGRRLDSIVFCATQFFVCALCSSVMMFIFERPVDLQGVKTALVPLAYTGCLSSAFCVTLQVKVQKEVNPTIASLIMCLESVFGAVGGWLILHEVLSLKEMLGCLLMFTAIVLSQLPDKKKIQ